MPVGHLRIGKTLVEADNALVLKSATAPLSGTSGTGAGTYAAPGTLLRALGVTYVNEHTLASPYWTPVSLRSRQLIAWDTDFLENTGKAESDTAASAAIGGGVKVAGQGIEVNGDSGLVITNSELGRIGVITVTNEVNHTVTLSPIGTSPMFQPDTHGPFVVDAEFTNNVDKLTRQNFLGFCGSNADEFDPPVLGDTVTVTFTTTFGDDVAGILMDSRLTDAAGLMCVSDKDNANATQLVSATGVDSGTDMPAAGTYVRLRVQCSAAGTVTYFRDKVQIGSRALALEVTEEVSPVLYLASTDTNTHGMSVKRFTAWGTRA